MSGRVRFCLFLLLWLPLFAYAACQLPTATTLPSPAANELLVASQNAWLFHDHKKDFRYDKAVPRAELTKRIEALANYIVKRLASPHMLALQEVENQQLLKRLTDEIGAIGGPDYQIHFLANQDAAGNGVALLTRSPVEVGRLQGAFKGRVVPQSRRSPLFSRLPLEVEIKRPLSMRVLVVHLRSANQLETDAYVRNKRRGQAQALVQWARLQKEDYVVLGDFNTAPGQGAFSEPWNLLDKAGWKEVKPAEKTPFTYVYRCQKQQLDHIYLSTGLWPRVSRSRIAHGNAGHYDSLYRYRGSRVVSDHDAIAVYLTHH